MHCRGPPIPRPRMIVSTMTGLGFPQLTSHCFPVTALQSGDHRPGVHLTAPTGKGTVQVGVGADHARTLMVPDRLKRHLKFLPREGAVVAGDHDIDLLRIVGDRDAGLGERANERLLADGVHHRIGCVLQDPLRRRVHRGDDLLNGGGQAEPFQLVRRTSARPAWDCWRGTPRACPVHANEPPTPWLPVRVRFPGRSFRPDQRCSRRTRAPDV